MRWSAPGLSQALRSLAGSSTGGHDAPPNLSVVVGGARRVVRDKHHLYVQGALLAAAASDGRLVRGVVRAGAGLVAAVAPDALLVRAIPVIAPDGTAVLVDSRANSDLRAVQARLERSGHRVVDTPWVVADAAARLVLGDAAAQWRIDCAALDEQFPPGPADDDLTARTAPITRLIALSPAVPESPAAAIALAAGLVYDDRAGPGRLRTADVARLARLSLATDLVAYRSGDPASLLGLIETARRT